MCWLGQSVVKLGCGVAVKEWIERYLAPAQEMLGVVIHWVSLGIVTFQVDFVCSKQVKCLQSGLGSPWLNQAAGFCCWLLCRSKAFHGQVQAPWDRLELGRLVQRTEGEPLNLESGAEQSWPVCDLGIHLHFVGLGFLVCKMEVLPGLQGRWEG